MVGERFGRLVVIWEGLSSVGNDILPYPMPYFAGVYGNCYGNRPTLPLRPHQLLERRVVTQGLEVDIAVEPDAIPPTRAERISQQRNRSFAFTEHRCDACSPQRVQ